LAQPLGSSALEALRRRIADVVPVDELGGDGAAGRAFATGVAALDAALRGGVPRGRITEILGAPGTGKTTLARRIVARALAAGEWVAYVDATRTLAPRDWATRGAPDAPLWVVRPPDAARAAWCADVLLRSAAFGLVVVDGAPALSRAVAVRLLQLARDADAALLLLADGPRASDVGGALRLRTERRRTERHAHHAHHAHHVRVTGRAGLTVLGASAPGHAGHAAGRARRVRSFAVTVEKGGTQRTVEVSCAVDVARRLCTHPEVPDRRGVAGAARRDGPRVVPDVAAAHAAVPQRRARRCAEPVLGRA
jgi:hypothetical protein